MSRPKQKRTKAFTLVELMVVIIVIGVLAAIAIPAYTKHIQEVRMQEARIVLPQIRLKQQTYYLEFRKYIVASNNPVNAPCGGGQEVWNNGITSWQTLGFIPPTPGVYFQYYVKAGISGSSLSETCGKTIVGKLHYPDGGDWFMVCAYGNLIESNCGTPSSTGNWVRFGMSGSEIYNRVFASPNAN